LGSAVLAKDMEKRKVKVKKGKHGAALQLQGL
jgi:hypothetical protein